jgi:hypothetical protein
MANGGRGLRESRPSGIVEAVRSGLADIEAEAPAIFIELYIQEVDALIQLAAEVRE